MSANIFTLYISIMLMKQKYYNLTGDTAFHLWMFATLLDELKNSPQKGEKLSIVLDQVTAYARGNWVKYNATDEEKRDLETIREKLLAL